MSNAQNGQAVPRLLEGGEPAADERAFRRCLGQYATGISVITTRHGERRFGMAVNSFAAVSLDPPLILWSIRRASSNAAAFLEAAHFAVNVLADDQVEVSQRFGAAHPERFERCTWTTGLGDAPLLQGAVAQLECQREAVHEGGDHLIVVGRVARYARFAGEPLLFTQGQYAVARNHPRLSTPSSASPAVTEAEQLPFLRLLSGAHQHLSAEFDTHRRAFGVTVATGRVLSRLHDGPRSRGALELATYLGREDLEDALRELAAKGQVCDRGDGAWELTEAGRQTRAALARCAADFEARHFAGAGTQDLAATRRVLALLQP